MKKALFLDRDGVVNVDVGYAHLPEQIVFMDGIFDVARRAHAAGYLLIVITNQSGIGRGMYTEAQFHALMRWILERFDNEGAPITAYYFCPHTPDDGCGCRKPKPGMLLTAAREHGIDLANSIMIGDKETDMQAADAAGVKVRWMVKAGEGLMLPERLDQLLADD